MIDDRDDYCTLPATDNVFAWRVKWQPDTGLAITMTMTYQSFFGQTSILTTLEYGPNLSNPASCLVAMLALMLDGYCDHAICRMQTADCRADRWRKSLGWQVTFVPSHD